MLDFMKLIQEADVAAVDFENARAHVEIMKQNLDAAKATFDEARTALDEVIAKADELGIPRAKVKKLIEERTQVLVASGLIAAGSSPAASPKAARAPKKSKPITVVDASETAIDFEEDANGAAATA